MKWDNSGRIFSICLTRDANEGIRIFKNDGELVLIVEDKQLNSISWRPRHKLLIDEKELEQKITANLTEIKEKYAEEDAQFLSEEDQKKMAEAKIEKSRFEEFFLRRKKVWNEQEAERKKLGAYEVDHSSVNVEITVEHIKEKQEEIVRSLF